MGLMMGLVVACNDTTDSTQDTSSDVPDDQQQLGLLEWDRDPSNIVLRVDRQLIEGDPVEMGNAVPLCTVWGDGYITWVNTVPTADEREQRIEILESYLTDEQLRTLIEAIIFSGFYNWESNFLIPDVNAPVIERITLNLFSENRTVSRYSDWPVNGFERILEACTQATDSPALYQPDGVWLSAVEVPYMDGVGHWRWYTEAAGFNLSAVSDGQSPQWVTGELARELWTVTILASAESRVLDGDQAYRLIVQAPMLTRDAPPAPADS